MQVDRTADTLPRKAYQAPRLVTYGAVEDLTGQQIQGQPLGLYGDARPLAVPTDGRPFGS